MFTHLVSTTRKNTSFLAIATVGSILALVSGCYFAGTKVTRGNEIEGAAISRIVIGKTTQRDVFALFGTPHSIFQGQQEFEESQAIGFGHLHPFAFYSHKENRYLSTLNDNQYAILYRFNESSARSLVITLPPIVPVIGHANTDITIRTDELLLFLNKDTKIVEDAAYPKQPSTQ